MTEKRKRPKPEPVVKLFRLTRPRLTPDGTQLISLAPKQSKSP